MLKKSHNKLEITELKYENTVLKDHNSICNAFNDHFSSVAERLQSTIAANNCPLCANVRRVKQKMKLKPTSEGEICKIISKMEPKTSCGYDGVSNALLKSLVPVIKGPLCTIFNKLLNQGVFPNLMKLAKIIPLYKGRERDMPTTIGLYRSCQLCQKF